MSQTILRDVSAKMKLLYENNSQQLNCQKFSNSKIDGVVQV